MKNLFILFLIFFFHSMKLVAQHDQISNPSDQHPEKGILPFNAPCKDCVEDLSKRLSDTREFYKNEPGGGKLIYRQQSLGAINFKDEKGYWRTIDPILKKEHDGVYAARMQPAPVQIDILNKVSTISYAGRVLQFNKNISLVHISSTGVETNLGKGDWSHISQTDNFSQSVILISDFYSGIDLQMIASYGNLETNFIIKSKQSFSDGWLTMNQQLVIPEGLHMDLSMSEPAGDDRNVGKISVADRDGKDFFYFKSAHAYDANESVVNYVQMSYALHDDILSYYVPVSFLNDKSTAYPVVIDPYVSATDSLIESAITGSGYTTVCDSFGCSYYINNFSVPVNCEIVKIEMYFSYLANFPCVRSEGGFGITMTSPVGTCQTPNFACISPVIGTCYFWPALLPSLYPCIPAPQCGAYNLDFEMKFRRCNPYPVSSCDGSCIGANSPWIMTVTGRTVEMTNVSLSQTICEGGCIDIGATVDWGVQPYYYSWAPGGMTGNLINVCPANTTTYFVTATDACGNTDTASTTISVTNGQSPGFSIFPDDSVCGGSQLTFTANSSDPDSMFSWIINCQSVDTITDTKVVNYAAPGVPSVCTIEMLYHVTNGNSSCMFTTIDTFYVMTGSSPEVSISGPDSVCVGTSSTYIATANFGGPAPVFQWYLDGNLIPGADSSTYTSVFTNGQSLVVTMTSTDSCSLGAIVSDTVQTAVANYILPDVAIHTFIDTICSGTQESFTRSIHNFGGNPRTLWFQNGVLADSGYSFLTTVNFGDEIVCMLIAGLTCPLSDTVTDTSTIIILPLTAPIVDIISSADTICAGDTVIFSSTVSNIAIPPSYRWYRNGNFVGLNPTYTSGTLNSSDTIVLLIFTPNPCGPDSASDTVVVIVNPPVSPAVSLIGPDTLCSGDTIRFSASAINGGIAPSYEWYINGVLTGTDSVFSASSLATGDSIQVIMRSSEACALPDSAYDSAGILVVPTVVPQVSISASPDTVCIGDPVTFIAFPIGGGASPLYQWSLNGVPIAAATSSTYTTSSLTANDTIGVWVTSSAQCTDPDMAADFISIVVENCLGVEIPATGVFTLVPNPASDELFIEFSSPSFSSNQIFLYDALGRNLFETRNEKGKKIRIDISSYSPGIYFVKVMQSGKSYLQKVVVE